MANSSAEGHDSSASAQPFGNQFPIDFSLQQCTDIYGMPKESVAKAVDATNAAYGGLNYSGTRVLFVNGDVDPWHALCVKRTCPCLPGSLVSSERKGGWFGKIEWWLCWRLGRVWWCVKVAYTPPTIMHSYWVPVQAAFAHPVRRPVRCRSMPLKPLGSWEGVNSVIIHGCVPAHPPRLIDRWCVVCLPTCATWTCI